MVRHWLNQKHISSMIPLKLFENTDLTQEVELGIPRSRHWHPYPDIGGQRMRAYLLWTGPKLKA